MSPLTRARSLLRRLVGQPPTPQERWDALQAQLHASEEDVAIAHRVRQHTMTGPVRLQAMLDAVAYLTARDIPGAFVECGVWRGGSVLAMLLKLQALDRADRDIYLYDTFEGMTAPTAADTSAYETPALSTWREAAASGRRAWGNLFDERLFSEQRVRQVLLDSGYPAARLHFVKGPVEETLPATRPGQIALLRLDTDWYESTRHELHHLYPLLVPGGVLMIDDYGHWDGCRRAVDEYFASPGVAPLLLQRIDYTGRIAVRS